jgi:HupE / UreJ protein
VPLVGTRPPEPPAGGSGLQFVTARAAVLVTVLMLGLSWAALKPPAATAHFRSLSAVELELGKDLVTGRVRLPYEMVVLLPLEGEPETEPELIASIRRYVGHHIAVQGANGKPWTVKVSGGKGVQGNGFSELVFGLSLTPPRGRVSDFNLSYDAIIEQVPTHRAVLLLRQDDGGNQVLGYFESGQSGFKVDAAGGGSSTSHFDEFSSAIGLGVNHISEGTDHLLFLMMLLLPAPLMIRRGRWVRCDDPVRSVIRIVHVVTAFAIGHSITLALAGLGLIHVPERPIEALIAFSILVAAIHVLRPLIPRGEPVIAVTFGLVHGLAFASLLGDLNLQSSALVFTLFGFNVGIELTQLLVVALMMPSLYVLSRTDLYTWFRVGGGVLGIVLSVSWLLQRTSLTPSDPFEPFTNIVVEQPFLVPAAMAAFAAAAYLLSSSRAPLWPRPSASGDASVPVEAVS